jgi:hypothetical protein
MPNLRHQASGGGTVTIISSVAIVNDTTWSTIVESWRRRRLQLYVDRFSRASSTAAATSTSALLGLLDLARLQRRHRAHRVLRLILDPRHGAAMARLLRPWNELPALIRSMPPATPLSTGMGLVIFLMG